jgi:hypothetical protein
MNPVFANTATVTGTTLRVPIVATRYFWIAARVFDLDEKNLKSIT